MKIYANSEVFICIGVERVIAEEIQIYGEKMKSELESGDRLDVLGNEVIIKDVYSDEVVVDQPSELAKPGLEIAITFAYFEADIFWEELRKEIERNGPTVLKILRD